MNLSNLKALREQRGFTIVELLIVIVVIGILAAIVIVAYVGVTNKANQSAAQGNAESIQKVAEAYNADNSAYPTTAQVNSYNGTSRKPSGVTLDTTLPTGSLTGDKGGTHIFYKEKGTTGGCIGYWDVVQNSLQWKYVGDATNYNPGTSTCS